MVEEEVCLGLVMALQGINDSVQENANSVSVFDKDTFYNTRLAESKSRPPAYLHHQPLSM